MNSLACFALLGLSPAFELDEKALESAYFHAQRLHHPDRFVGKPQPERAAAMQRSVDINEAYRTLKDPLSRAQALLAMHNIIVGTDTDTVKPSQPLLMESMHWREGVDEAQAVETLAAHTATLDGHYTDCLARIAALYGAGDYAGMAQETLRLSYLRKARQAAAQKAKRLTRM
ncbi:MAG: Fe-S protein assembly co-chaperone HscB [Proteobacteria bacterium]|nr:Fe-S protein assembly co-chaperone HscB [Pseudomonadota bacterium]